MNRRGKTVAAVGVTALSSLLLVGCSSSSVDETTRDSTGEITERGEVGAFKLHVGDCVYDPNMLATESTADVVESFKGVPCDELHTGEVIHVDDYFFADEASMPPPEVIQSRVGEECVTELENYTGVPYEESNYDIYTLYPSEDSWDLMDDRGIVCLGLVLSDNTWLPIESVGSMKAAG